MKRNKRGLILTLLLTFALGINVSVVDAAIPTSKCKDGKVYTNYYYLLDANTFSGQAVTNAGGVAAFMNTWTHITQGIYTNNIILLDGLADTGFQNYTGYEVQKGTVKVSSSASDGVNNMNISDFYDAIFAGKNHTNGSWTDADGVTSHIVGHSYKRVDSSTLEVGDSIITSTLDVTEASKSDLIQASVKLGSGPSIQYIDLNDSNNFAKDMILQISRTYANPSGYNGAFSTISPVSLNSKTWYLQPAVYYIQYCESGTGVTNKKVTYDANSTDPVSNLPGEQTAASTKCIKLSSNTLVRNGYTFLGWSTDKNAKEPDSKYAAGSDYCETADLKLYAVWKQNSGQYTISYNANGGQDAPQSQTGNTGSCLKISDQKPKQTGNNFLGWSTDKNAKEADAKYASGQEYCGENGDLQLYAVWQTQTGVSAHLVAFSIVAIAAGVALVVAKKKDLFRQI